MKSLEIWAADWCFVQKKTGKPVIAKDVVCYKLPFEIEVIQTLEYKRALDSFGDNKKNFIAELEKKDGSPIVTMIIYRKYISDSHVQYEIKDGKLKLFSPEGSKIETHGAPVVHSNVENDKNKNTEPESMVSSTPLEQTISVSQTETVTKDEVIETESTDIDWSKDF